MDEACDGIAPRWQLSVFGGPVLTRRGEIVGLTAYQNALLALVACSADAVRRAQLVKLFYGVRDGYGHRRRLSQLVYSINRRCDFYIVKGTNNTVGLNEAITLDLASLATKQSDLTPISCRPLTRLQPPFPSAAFESWLREQRARLVELARGINAEALELAWSAGDLKCAKEAAVHLLESLPTHSRAIKIFVEIVAMQEGRANAMAWLARHREQYLGGENPADDCGAEKHIFGIEAFPKGPDPHHDSSQVPFVGRSREVSQVLGPVLDSDAAWRGILVQGEAGSGKSRLLRELQRRLAPEDCVVATINLRPGDSFDAFSLLRLLLESAPFSAVARTLSREDRSVLAAAVGAPDVVEAPPLQVAEARQQRLFRVLAKVVEAVGRRFVLMIDDARFADQGSLAALSHLRQVGSNWPGRVICTDRSGKHQAGLRMAMIRELLVLSTIVDLAPLTSEQSSRLVRHVANTEDDRLRLLDRVVELSGGNPFFLIELTRLYSDVVSTDGDVELPETLEKLIAGTIQDLNPNTKALLKILAVQLGTVSLERLSGVSEMPRYDLLASIEEASQAKLLSCDHVGVSFRHGLTQEWLYRSLAAPERRFLHSATALYLEGHERDRSSDLAFHYHRAGNAKAAAIASLGAAEDALQRGACADAIAFFETALDSTSSDIDRFDLLERLSHLYSLQGSLHESLDRAASALELQGASRDRAAVWGLQIRRATAAAELGTAAPGVLHRELDSVIREAKEAPDSWLSALDAAVTIANGTLEDSRARALLKELESRDFANQRIQCRANLLKTFHLAHGTPSVASAASEEAIGIAEANGYEDLLMKAIFRAVIVRSWQGTLDDDQINKWKADVAAIAESTGNVRGLWAFHINIATWLLDTLRSDEAYQWIQEAKDIGSGWFDTIMDVGLENNLGEYYLLKKDFCSASEHFQRAVASPNSMRRGIHLSASAGFGYCLIARGMIRDALAVDANLPSNDDIVQIRSFDPSNLVLFRARLLSVRRQLGDGLRLIREARCKLEDRHLPAWFKLGRLEMRFLKRLGDQNGLRKAAEGAISKAYELRLSEIARDFKAVSPL